MNKPAHVLVEHDWPYVRDIAEYGREHAYEKAKFLFESSAPHGGVSHTCTVDSAARTKILKIFLDLQKEKKSKKTSYPRSAKMLQILHFIVLVALYSFRILAGGFVPPAEMCLPSAHLDKLAGCIAMTDKEDECGGKENEDEKLECFCTQEMLSSFYA